MWEKECVCGHYNEVKAFKMCMSSGTERNRPRHRHSFPSSSHTLTMCLTDKVKTIPAIHWPTHKYLYVEEYNATLMKLKEHCKVECVCTANGPEMTCLYIYHIELCVYCWGGYSRPLLHPELHWLRWHTQTARSYWWWSRPLRTWLWPDTAHTGPPQNLTGEERTQGPHYGLTFQIQIISKSNRNWFWWFNNYLTASWNLECTAIVNKNMQ